MSLTSVYGETMNCLSIDVEGFVEANLESFFIDKKKVSGLKANDEIERNVHIILDQLHSSEVKATFFFLGRIGKEIPSLVRRVSQYGHEIACHSYEHLRIYGCTKEIFRQDVVRAKKTLEDVSGQHILGFRAPDFSIIGKSLWALDILREEGFVYDSSIYPVGGHDVYGIEEFSPVIHKLQNGLIEFPLSTFKVLGKRLPFGGGGYFRIYPLAVTSCLIRRLNEKKDIPCMFYIHPYEIGPIIPQIGGMSWLRRFRHYYNCDRGSERLSSVLSRFKFGTIISVIQERGFDVPLLKQI